MNDNVIYQKNNGGAGNGNDNNNQNDNGGANGSVPEPSNEIPKVSAPSSTELTPEFQNLINYFEQVKNFENKDVVSPIHVDELASKLALLYEKLRRIIDWKDEHLLRRTAIDRALKRSMISKLSGISLTSGVTGAKLAEPLLMELIRSGHFGNGKISKTKLPAVQLVLDKYIYILSYSSIAKNINPLSIKKKVEFYNWILEIAAGEIEDVLEPPLRELSMVNFMTSMMSQRTNLIPSNGMTQQDKIIQFYVAVQRTLYSLDNPFIAYQLIKYRYPDWSTNPNAIIRSFTENIEAIWKQIEGDLNHPKASEFYKLCEKYDATYLILGDALNEASNSPGSIMEQFSDWDKLKMLIKKVYDERVATLKKRLRRSAIYSTLSIFLAGGVSLFLFEVPLAHLVYGEFRPLAIFVDIMIPTAIMFLLVSIIRPPKPNNFEVLLDEIQKVVYSKTGKDIYELRLKKTTKFFRNLIFIFFYLLGTVVSYGVVFWIFYIANVPWTSLYIDTANVAIIIFAALVIRQKSKEVTVEEGAGFGDFVIDIFSIPMAKLGQWLAEKWKEYNFVSVFFTAVIDVPILIIVQMIEDWRTFLRDKRAGIH